MVLCRARRVAVIGSAALHGAVTGTGGRVGVSGSAAQVVTGTGVAAVTTTGVAGTMTAAMTGVAGAAGGTDELGAPAWDELCCDMRG